MRSKHESEIANNPELGFPKANDYKKKLASIEDYSFDRKGNSNSSIDVMVHQHEAWAKSFDVPSAPVKGKRAIFSNMNLKGQDFSGRDLRAADFRFSELEGADFKGADLTLADFSGANVENANFNGATLIKTIFRDTLTDGANFADIVESY
jgi:uncharacterized protein YjbI with pentapeptide repeats